MSTHLRCCNCGGSFGDAASRFAFYVPSGNVVHFIVKPELVSIVNEFGLKLVQPSEAKRSKKNCRKNMPHCAYCDAKVGVENYYGPNNAEMIALAYDKVHVGESCAANKREKWKKQISSLPSIESRDEKTYLFSASANSVEKEGWLGPLHFPDSMKTCTQTSIHFLGALL